MSRRRALTNDGQIITAHTLDAEYQRRGLIRPSQFRKIHAEKQSEYVTVSFEWKGTKVHGFKTRYERDETGAVIAITLTDDEAEALGLHDQHARTTTQLLADDR